MRRKPNKSDAAHPLPRLPTGQSATHQDETGIVAVPPAEGRHADFRVLVVVEDLTSAVGVAAQDEAGLKPSQQLRPMRQNFIYLFIF